MPHAFRIFKSLKSVGCTDDCAMAAASIVERTRGDDFIFRSERIVDELHEAGFEEDRAEALCGIIRCCSAGEKFSIHFERSRLKTNLVRSGFAADQAESLLNAFQPAIAVPLTAEIRKPIRHPPAPGKVVMCDFRFLSKPEMQKERRAIVISSRSADLTGRCIVVPVSKSEAREPNALHFRFAPGAYRFFHQRDPVWAVCDHIYTVSLSRLWQVNIARRPEIPAISTADLAAIRVLVGTALGVPTLTDGSVSGIEPAPAGKGREQLLSADSVS